MADSAFASGTLLLSLIGMSLLAVCHPWWGASSNAAPNSTLVLLHAASENGSSSRVMVVRYHVHPRLELHVTPRAVACRDQPATFDAFSRSRHSRPFFRALAAELRAEGIERSHRLVLMPRASPRWPGVGRAPSGALAASADACGFFVRAVADARLTQLATA